MVLGDVTKVLLEGDLDDVDDAIRHGREQAEAHPQHVAGALSLRLQGVHIRQRIVLRV